jgi:hypothetical protein
MHSLSKLATMQFSNRQSRSLNSSLMQLLTGIQERQQQHALLNVRVQILVQNSKFQTLKLLIPKRVKIVKRLPV